MLTDKPARVSGTHRPVAFSQHLKLQARGCAWRAEVGVGQGSRRPFPACRTAEVGVTPPRHASQACLGQACLGQACLS